MRNPTSWHMHKQSSIASQTAQPPNYKFKSKIERIHFEYSFTYDLRTNGNNLITASHPKSRLSHWRTAFQTLHTLSIRPIHKDILINAERWSL